MAYPLNISHRSLPEAQFGINVSHNASLAAHLESRDFVELSDDVKDVQFARAEDVMT